MWIDECIWTDGPHKAPNGDGDHGSCGASARGLVLRLGIEIRILQMYVGGDGTFEAPGQWLMDGGWEADLAATFDTMRTARTLESSGLPRQQAEAVAEATLSGQCDLADQADLRADVASLRLDLRAEIATAVNRMMLAQLAIAGTPFAALKLL